MYEYKVKVTDVIDGDTIDVVIDLGFDIFTNRRVRLAGIDTPESRTTDLNEKKFGMEAKEYLKHLLGNASNVVIKTLATDVNEKYGRVLGQVYIESSTMSVNDLLVSHGYAWSYDGGAKVKDYGALLAKRMT
jgi:micrococcal nuclease